MVVTPTGARITPAVGETMIFSYEKKSALIVDATSRSFFLLPLDLVPALLAVGLGYDPRGLGASASGATKTILGTACGEVVVSGKAPRVTLRSCRVADPVWSRDYARLEGALGLPWTIAEPPPVFVGLPLAGSLEIEGARPYRASWEITKLSATRASARISRSRRATGWIWSGSSPCSAVNISWPAGSADHRQPHPAAVRLVLDYGANNRYLLSICSPRLPGG